MKHLKIILFFTRAAEFLLILAVLLIFLHFVPDFKDRGDASREEIVSEADASDAENMSGADASDAENVSDADAFDAENVSDADVSDAENVSEAGASGAKNLPGADERWTENLPEESYAPPILFFASDLHYQSPEMTDFGESFEALADGSDGTIVPYVDSITDAFLEEVMAEKPSALILSGDLSLNGERKNHEALAEKLGQVQDAGVPVLVLPGNHDINHPWAASYFGSEMQPAEGVDDDGFYEIYREFGFDSALSRDEESLSYVYELDERYRIMMLDSCIYEPEHETGGRIREATLSWMKEQLDEAAARGVTVIPVAHHNLLRQSTLYPEECTLENGREVTELLESYGTPVYVSGHLHLQRIKKHTAGPSSEDEYGIHEIVSSPLSMAPCQYGRMEWTEDGSVTYRTKPVDIEEWAERYGVEDPNLLNFEEYAENFLVENISRQAFLGMESIPKERKEEMAQLYGRLNRNYSAGTPVSAAEVKKSDTYLYWTRYQGAGVWAERLKAILKDTKRDHTSLTLTAGADFPGHFGENNTENEHQNIIKKNEEK